MARNPQTPPPPTPHNIDEIPSDAETPANITDLDDEVDQYAAHWEEQEQPASSSAPTFSLSGTGKTDMPTTRP